MEFFRYNQISPHCAEYLCKIIRANKSLKSMDLSWNTLGLQGGQLLLNALRENKIITILSLCGNYVPQDIALAIDRELQKNRQRYTKAKYILSADTEIVKSPRKDMTEKQIAAPTVFDDTFFETVHIPAQRVLMSQKKKVKILDLQAPINIVEDNNQINPIVELNSKGNVESQDDNNTDHNMCVNISSKNGDDQTIEVDIKIADLNKMLQEHTVTIDLLTNEIATKVTQIDETRTQVISLQAQIDQLQQEKEKFNSDKMKEIAELSKRHDEAEENWQKNYKDLENKNNECLRNKKDAESKVIHTDYFN